MIEQAEEIRQMKLEAELSSHLEEIYVILQAWDAAGHEELAEEMTGYVAEWKDRLE